MRKESTRTVARRPKERQTMTQRSGVACVPYRFLSTAITRPGRPQPVSRYFYPIFLEDRHSTLVAAWATRRFHEDLQRSHENMNLSTALPNVGEDPVSV